MQPIRKEKTALVKIRNLFCVLLGTAMLVALIAAITPVSRQGQGGNSGKDVNVVNTPNVNVVNTPNVNVTNPITLSAGTSVDVSSSASNPIFVREMQTTAVAFQSLDTSFSALQNLGDIDVSPYRQIRVVVQNQGAPFSLTLTLVEAGRSIGNLDVIDVPGACPDVSCGNGRASVTRVYEVPGRTIRLSSNADRRIKGDVVIFGR